MEIEEENNFEQIGLVSVEIENENVENELKNSYFAFLNDLQLSLNSSNVSGSMSYQNLQKLKSILIFNTNLLEIAVALMILYFYSNVPQFHFDKFLLFFLWIILDVTASFFFRTSRQFFSKFVSLFIESYPEKITTPSKNGKFLIYDFQKKFNSKEFRKALFDGKKKKYFQYCLEDVNDGLILRKLNENWLKKQ